MTKLLLMHSFTYLISVLNCINGAKITHHAAYQQKKHDVFLIYSLQDDNARWKSTWKLNHSNSVLEYFEYFCQIPSQLILIILSYTVSKMVHFGDAVYNYIYVFIIFLIVACKSEV